MNLLSVARHGIGIAGIPPVAVAIARALAIDVVEAADPETAIAQFAGGEADAAWLARLAPAVRRAPLPPGIVFALRVSNGPHPVGSLLVAERERDLGERPAVVVRVAPTGVELDRRDGSPALAVTPRMLGLEAARELARRGRAD